MNNNMDAINEHRQYISELRKQLAERDARIAELEAEMHAIRFAAHMPNDYEHGLPSWINQHLYGKLVDWTDVDGLPIRRSEDVEHMIRQNRRIAELEAAQAWVSVDERLPNDEDEGVIVWTNNGSDYKFYNYDIGFYHEKNGWLLSTEWEHGDPTVTHWMPLPPPPVTPET